MKTIAVSALFMSSLLALGDPAPAPPPATTPAPAPATAATPAASDTATPAPAPAAADEKSRALEINTQLQTMAQSRDKDAKDWDDVMAKIDNYQKEFGVSAHTNNNITILRKYELNVAKVLVPDRFDALVQQLAKDPIPAVAAAAGEMVAIQKKLDDLKTTPIELTYTAVDGTEVDLSKLRGKVVMIDFWATWCGPCVEAMPDVIATYKKYHDQGFEIVGVSLDEDKAALLAFTKQNAMPWPQYFDGRGWNNSISKGYDIHSIPAMWLFDKKGVLVTMKAADDDLGPQVEKLLKAP